MPSLVCGDIQIHYEVFGTGPAILFAHESTGDHTSWQAQVEHFARRFSCIVYDARGYRFSTAPASPARYSQSVFVDDMLAVLDHLQVRQAHIVGLSMGSMTALHFGLRHKHRALSLVLAGTGPGQSRQAVAAFNEQALAFAQRLDAQGWTGVLEEYDAAPDRRDLRWKNPLMHRQYWERLVARDSRLSATILRSVVANRPVLADISGEIAALDLPVLIATGDQDSDCLPTSLFLRTLLRRSGLAVFPNTGHAVNLEEPQLFNAALDGFYNSIVAERW